MAERSSYCEPWVESLTNAQLGAPWGQRVGHRDSWLPTPLMGLPQLAPHAKGYRLSSTD